MKDHLSSCAVHNEPAFPAGPCDCGAGMTPEQQKFRENVKAIIASGCGCDRACEQTGDCGCSRDADAAIAVALEEAARVAQQVGRDRTFYPFDGSPPKPLLGQGDEIAAAIRALIPCGI